MRRYWPAMGEGQMPAVWVHSGSVRLFSTENGEPMMSMTLQDQTEMYDAALIYSFASEVTFMSGSRSSTCHYVRRQVGL